MQALRRCTQSSREDLERAGRGRFRFRGMDLERTGRGRFIGQTKIEMTWMVYSSEFALMMGVVASLEYRIDFFVRKIPRGHAKNAGCQWGELVSTLRTVSAVRARKNQKKKSTKFFLLNSRPGGPPSGRGARSSGRRKVAPNRGMFQPGGLGGRAPSCYGYNIIYLPPFDLGSHSLLLS
jgi:hypothetical protein